MEGTYPGHRHRSAEDTVSCVTNLFYSPGLLQATLNLVRNCDKCARAPKQAQQHGARAPSNPTKPKGRKRGRNGRKRASGQQFQTTASDDMPHEQQGTRQVQNVRTGAGAQGSQLTMPNWDIDDKPDNFIDDTAVKRKVKTLRNTITISFSGDMEIKIPA